MDEIEPPLPAIDRHRLLRVLGEGGMGLVYEAEQLEPVRRRVALKVLKAGFDSKAFLGRFEAERQALAMMNHPNIARLYEAGAMADGRPWYSMEYVPGVPVTEYCDDQKLDTRSRVSIMSAICSAVQHAHDKGVLHRDLKPSNLLVARVNDEPVVKVIDFGIAKALTGRLSDRTFATELHRPVGTVPYMSPEQWEAGTQDLDARTDVYSLGVVLFELLVGTLPHDEATLARLGIAAGYLLRDNAPPTPSDRVRSLAGEREIVARHRHTTPDLLRRELRGDLDWITLRALAPERQHRYPSAREFGLDLDRYMRGEPVAARAPTFRYRVSRFARRNPAKTAVGIMLLLMLVWTTASAVAGARERALRTMLLWDLRNLVVAEEAYFASHGRYTSTLSELADRYTPSRDVRISFVDAANGWQAVATHAERPDFSCVIFVGMNLEMQGEPLCRTR